GAAANLQGSVRECVLRSKGSLVEGPRGETVGHEYDVGRHVAVRDDRRSVGPDAELVTGTVTDADDDGLGDEHVVDPEISGSRGRVELRHPLLGEEFRHACGSYRRSNRSTLPMRVAVARLRPR